MAKFTLTCEFDSEEELQEFVGSNNNFFESNDSQEQTQEQGQQQRPRRHRRTKAEIAAARAAEQAMQNNIAAGTPIQMPNLDHLAPAPTATVIQVAPQPIVEERPVVREEVLIGEVIPPEMPKLVVPDTPVQASIPNFSFVAPAVPATGTVVNMQPAPEFVVSVAPAPAPTPSAASGLPADLLGALGGKL